ncbi:hypothetical protein BIY24_14555 [Halobacteriovorax marinus]|uniref:LysE family translocator n=1 Tax=Halobacteriovorax marinus TaxID=97084 RepID=UPI000BC304E5|nr:LysE family translocator [Halobacteriovorax marinus]ATH09119.1 hypothetical protein BIY24_14555 [Halobacteriovorax marinus]
MNLESITALLSFALVSSITPGPNNIMLMSSGTNFGFKRSLPHMLGINLGFTFMLILIGIGLSQIFNLYPVIQTILKFVGVAYLIYLSYKIARSSSVQVKGDNQARPLTFFQAALFQWVNPKAWTMATAAVTLYAPTSSYRNVAIVAISFSAMNFPAICTWTLLGKQIRKKLDNPRFLLIFNYIMALLLLSSLYFIAV